MARALLAQGVAAVCKGREVQAARLVISAILPLTEVTTEEEEDLTMTITTQLVTITDMVGQAQ